jgi:hypothetical protein
MGKPEIYEQDDAIIGRAFVASLAVIGGIAVLGGGIWFFANSGDLTIETNVSALKLPEVRNAAKIDYPAVSFTDVTKDWGIDFVHVNGAKGGKLLPETMGSGCAAVDYDGDGDIDLLFVNSQSWEADESNTATMKLFRNDDGQFHDVTVEVGLNVSLSGMGVAVGDIENDGDLDIFISAVGTNRLFVQQDGKFVDTTKAAGVAGDGGWSTSCGFLDYDRDGLLDLFVCNYVEWSQKLDSGQKFRLAGVGRAYGPPSAFVGTFPILYHNEGNGTFRDVSAEAGVQVKNTSRGVPVAKSLGIATVDIDQDGWIDILVANDTVRNFLFHNQKDGTFREVGTEAGIAFNSAGKARGAMGIDGDYVRDNGQLAVGIGNYSNESSALYVKQSSQLLFLDEATSTGFGPPTRLALTFGLFFFDVDLDGRLDIFGANGHLENEIEKVQESQKYAQEPHLFWNRGPGKGSNEFVKVPASVTGKAFADPVVGRGAVSADLDGDGDLDLVITQCGRRAKVLRNDQELGRNWVRVRAIGNGTSSNRDAIGATLEAHVNDRVIRRVISRTRSYLSQSEATVTIGIGESKQIERLKIVWPDGTTQEHAEPIEAGTTLTLEQM